MDDSDSNERSYKVGKGKPPKDFQWPKGTSGNPGGRPKGSASWQTVLQKVLKERSTLKIKGKMKRVTMKELVVRSAVQAAINKNDYKGLTTLGAFKEEVQDELPYIFTLKLEEDTPPRQGWSEGHHSPGSENSEQ